MAEGWITVEGVVQRGHRVASGLGDSPYPDGTIALQKPFFKALGLDLSHCHDGTLNVSIAPLTARLAQPDYTFPHLTWTTLHPPETFSFVRCNIAAAGQVYPGWVYYPHPETKRQHFQSASVLEVLAPWIADLSYGSAIALHLPPQAWVLAEGGDRP